MKKQFLLFLFCSSALPCFGASPANDDFADRTTLSGALPFMVSATTGMATAESGEPNHVFSSDDNVATNSVWWEWVPSTTEVVKVEAGGTGLDLTLSVYTGSRLDDLSVVAEVDDNGEDQGAEKLEFEAIAGERYIFAIDGWSESTGVVENEGPFILSLSATSSSTSPIIGAWVHNDGTQNDSDVLVFLPNGTYFHAEDSDVDTMQRGTFSWDETTSQLSLTPITVTGGSELPASLYFPIVGNQAEGGEFQRVTSESNPLVGGWSFGSEIQTDGVVVFLENGVYFLAEETEHDPPYATSGMERGTYSYDFGTRAFSAVVTTDTNGEVGFSNPEGPVKVSILGDELVYQPGFLKFLLSRVTVDSDRVAAVDEAQSLMASEDGMYGVMLNTVPGFFYTVERSSNLGGANASSGVEGDGTMSQMLLETDPATVPKAFFTTRVEIQAAIASADIMVFLDRQSLEGITFLSDGTWSSASDSGLWTYDVMSAGTGTVQLTSNENGNDPAQSRMEYIFDFAADDDLGAVATTFRSFLGETEVEMRTLTADLEPVPAVADLAPSVTDFSTLVVGKTIKGINFLANNRWSSFGEGGNWSYEVSSPTSAKLTIVFDTDANDPLIARDDYLMTFTEAGGRFQVATRIELSDENTVDEIQNTILDLTRNTFAPTVALFTYLLEDHVINSTVFDENGTFVYDGNETGRWTAVAVGDHQILLTQTYDEDGNNSQTYREESLLTFNGTTIIDLNYKEFDGGELDFEINTTLTLD